MPDAVIPSIKIQTADFDTAAEIARLSDGRTDIGAVVSFTGLCRSEDGRLSALELEHYAGMAEEEIGRIADQALQRWPISALTVIHRVGKIRPGENIVLVLAASAHREAAFDAAAFVMDFLKSRAPFWKKEHGVDGNQGAWVEARDADEQRLATWALRSD